MRNMVFMLGCCLVAFLAGVLVYFYKQPIRDFASQTGISVTATELFTQFNANHPQANETYLNKVITVSGRVLTIKNTPYAAPVVVLSTGDPLCGVACTLYQVSPAAQPVKPGQLVTIKGVCKGYMCSVMVSNSKLVN